MYFVIFYEGLGVRGSKLNTVFKMSIFNLWISRWSRYTAQHIMCHCYFFDMARRTETWNHFHFYTALLAATPELLQNPSAHLESSAMAFSCTAPELWKSTVRTLKWCLPADKQQVQAGLFTMIKLFCLSSCHLWFSSVSVTCTLMWETQCGLFNLYLVLLTICQNSLTLLVSAGAIRSVLQDSQEINERIISEDETNY